MPGFVLQTNGFSSQAFPPTHSDTDELKGFFSRMDGDRLFSYLLWELPPGRELHKGLKGLQPEVFIQCAGAADALTVEVREVDGAGGHVLSSLGRKDQEPGPRDVEVRWAGGRTIVHRNEVWSSEQAADLFLSWWRDGGLTDGLHRRPIERFPSQDKPDQGTG